MPFTGPRPSNGISIASFRRKRAGKIPRARLNFFAVSDAIFHKSSQRERACILTA